MLILLVIPTHYYKTYPTFLSVSDLPAGIAYLAGALKAAGHTVVGANPNNLPGYPSAFEMLQDVLSKALSSEIGLVGLGGLCTDYAFLKDAIGIIRRVSPKTPIVLGGNIVTYDAEFIFNHLKPDFAIVGEGEETIVKLANILAKGTYDFDSIDNLFYWQED